MGRENLKKAIDGAFSDERLEETLGNSTYGVENWRFNLPALTDALPGGALPASRRFEVNFEESFKALTDDERKEVESYYVERIASIGQDWRDRFPGAFGKLI